MALPQLLNDEVAGAASVGLVGLFAAWKLWLRVKKDNREDKSGADVRDGYASLLDEVQEQFNQQAERLKQQDEKITALYMRLEESDERRRIAADENHALRRQIAELEDNCKKEQAQLRERIKQLEEQVKRLESAK